MYQLSKIIVQFLAKIYLRRFKPTIIGVTGNAGKTSTKEIIGAVLGQYKKVRIGGGNLNNEVGLPFNVISGDADKYYENGGSLFFGIKTLFKAILGLFNSNYPKILVLEYGADHPGDIKKLVQVVRPHISVVTTVGDVPVHVEHFKDADAVAREKSELVRCLALQDFAVLNRDDERVFTMHEATQARMISYGFDERAKVQVSDFEYLSNEEGVPIGVTFKLHHESSFVPVHINGSLGKSQAWAAAGAAAVGLAMGINLVQISQALAYYHGPRGRLKILAGINNSHIVDDTYNASPASMSLALDVLKELPATRKIAVLGDMLELGGHTISAHRAIGQKSANIANIITCVGPRAKFIAESALETKLLSEEQVLTFETSEEAAQKLPALIRPHDLVLVKSSQGIRTEKIVKAIMADPSQAGKLLVRQSRKWLSK